MIYVILVGVVLGYALLTGYALQALKVLRTAKAIRYLFVLLSAGIILNVFWQWTQRDERVWTSVQLYSMGALLTWALTLATLSLVLFIEDIQRFINLLVKKAKKNRGYFSQKICKPTWVRNGRHSVCFNDLRNDKREISL